MRIATGLLVVALAAAALLLLAWLGQRRLMYLPMGGPVPHPRDAELATAVEVVVPTEDGLSLGAWFVEPTAPADGWTLILFNGNAGHRGFRAPLARRLSDRGIGVLMIDYRGFGGNEGSPTEEGLAADARVAAGEVLRAQQHRGPDDLLRERVAHAGCVAHEDVLLQPARVLGGNGHVAQRAEAGGDAVDAPALADPAVD